MIKKYQITEEEFEAILQAIKEVVGNPSGCINDKDTIKVCNPGVNCTSMCWDTFKDALKREFNVVE